MFFWTEWICEERGRGLPLVCTRGDIRHIFTLHILQVGSSKKGSSWGLNLSCCYIVLHFFKHLLKCCCSLKIKAIVPFEVILLKKDVNFIECNKCFIWENNSKQENNFSFRCHEGIWLTACERRVMSAMTCELESASFHTFKIKLKLLLS